MLSNNLFIQLMVTDSLDQFSRHVEETCCSDFIRLLLLLSPFSRIRLCATPQTAAHQAPPSLGFSRQEHQSGLPFPSPRLRAQRQQTSYLNSRQLSWVLIIKPFSNFVMTLQDNCFKKIMISISLEVSHGLLKLQVSQSLHKITNLKLVAE